MANSSANTQTRNRGGIFSGIGGIVLLVALPKWFSTNGMELMTNIVNFMIGIRLLGLAIAAVCLVLAVVLITVSKVGTAMLERRNR